MSVGRGGDRYIDSVLARSAHSAPGCTVIDFVSIDYRKHCDRIITKA